MWQKLNPLDLLTLERARIQLVNAVQLVCAAPRSYMPHNGKGIDGPLWNPETSSFSCQLHDLPNKLQITLDVKDLVLSIAGDDRHAEHLVLSGITYPMAFGWMRIKLDSFGLDGEQYNDQADYTLEKVLGSDDEMTVFDQQLFDDIAIYYSNATYMLDWVWSKIPFNGKMVTDPSNLHLLLSPASADTYMVPGFSIGSRFFPEPHFFIQITTEDQDILDDIERKGYLWKNKDWKGLLLPAGDFLSHDQDVELQKVTSFFQQGLKR